MPTPALGFVNLSTNAYSWLLEEAWKVEDFAYFSQKAPSPPLSIYHPVPFFREKKSSITRESCKWLLCSADKQNHSWAKVQVFNTHFRTIYLFLGPFPLSMPESMEALCLLLGSFFIAQKADNIFVLSEDSKWLQVFENDFTFKQDNIHCLKSDWLVDGYNDNLEQGDLPASSFVQRQKISLGRNDWQSSGWAGVINPKLAYLSTRQERMTQKKRPKTGRFAKLFPGSR